MVLELEYKAWQLLQTSQEAKKKKTILNLQTQTFFRSDSPIVNVLADTHFSFLSFLTAPTRSFFFLYIMVLNPFFTTGLAKIYPVATIKSCLEFEKMGQSTEKNKL